MTIKKQLKTNSGLLEGIVISVSSELLDGEIVSKVEILPDRWMNLNVNDSLVELHYPGGVLDNRALKVEGSPKFIIGEKVVVFTNKFKNKNWISNLGLGKFSIKTIGETIVMVNQIFPGYPEVSQMKMNKFYELSTWVKKRDFEFRFKDKYELSSEKQVLLRRKARVKGRSLASIKNDQKENTTHKFPAIWLVLFLGVLGVGFGMVRNKS
jgi:hypothetical protein